jgi:hypothetical protein
MSSFIAAAKRYTGYARFLSPVWAGYVALVTKYPRVSAGALLVTTFLAIF